MTAEAVQVVQDEKAGRITVFHMSLDSETGGAVSVSGDGIPTATVRRAGAPDPLTWVPIGSRDPRALGMRVGDIEVGLGLTAGGIGRKSFTVEADLGGTRYALVPHKRSASRVLRAGDRIAVMSERVGGRYTQAAWSAEPTAEEMALAYGLAAAFGVGADHPAAVLLRAFIELPSP